MLGSTWRLWRTEARVRRMVLVGCSEGLGRERGWRSGGIDPRIARRIKEYGIEEDAICD